MRASRRRSTVTMPLAADPPARRVEGRPEPPIAKPVPPAVIADGAEAGAAAGLATAELDRLPTRLSWPLGAVRLAVVVVFCGAVRTMLPPFWSKVLGVSGMVTLIDAPLARVGVKVRVVPPAGMVAGSKGAPMAVGLVRLIGGLVEITVCPFRPPSSRPRHRADTDRGRSMS